MSVLVTAYNRLQILPGAKVCTKICQGQQQANIMHSLCLMFIKNQVGFNIILCTFTNSAWNEKRRHEYMYFPEGLQKRAHYRFCLTARVFHFKNADELNFLWFGGYLSNICQILPFSKWCQGRTHALTELWRHVDLHAMLAGVAQCLCFVIEHD